MATRTLIDKIEALPPEKKAEVEDFVEFLSRKATPPETGGRRPALPPKLLEQIGADRDALLEEHGFIETNEILRDLRDNGGR